MRSIHQHSYQDLSDIPVGETSVFIFKISFLVIW